jgi:hypothetical protein
MLISEALIFRRAGRSPPRPPKGQLFEINLD